MGQHRGMQRALMLFDLDGTLLDHDGAELAAITGWIRDAGFPTVVGEVPSDELWRQIAEAAYADYVAGRTSFAEQRRLRARKFLTLMGCDPSSAYDDDMDAAFEEYARRYADALRPFDDVAGSLARLARDFRVAVLTNGDQAQQEGKVRRAGLDSLVEATIASSSLGCAKPDAAAFHGALARLGAAPEGTTYIGDRLDVDARAAASAGLAGVWLNRRGSVADAGPLRTITTLSALP